MPLPGLVPVRGISDRTEGPSWVNQSVAFSGLIARRTISASGLLTGYACRRNVPMRISDANRRLGIQQARQRLFQRSLRSVGQPTSNGFELIHVHDCDTDEVLGGALVDAT